MLFLNFAHVYIFFLFVVLFYTDFLIDNSPFLLNYEPFALCKEFFKSIVLLIVEHGETPDHSRKWIHKIPRLWTITLSNIRYFFSELLLNLVEKLLIHFYSQLTVKLQLLILITNKELYSFSKFLIPWQSTHNKLECKEY